MAISLQNSQLVWQKVAKALAGASPAAQEAFRNLKTYIATQGGNPQLQFVPFSAEQITTDGGYTPVVGTALVYGWYAKARRSSGTTAAFMSLHDATTNGATTTTIDTAKFNLTGQDAFGIHSIGFRLGTDLTVACATAVGGATESSAADAADGFVIVGA